VYVEDLYREVDAVGEVVFDLFEVEELDDADDVEIVLDLVVFNLHLLDELDGSVLELEQSVVEAREHEREDAVCPDDAVVRQCGVAEDQTVQVDVFALQLLVDSLLVGLDVSLAVEVRDERVSRHCESRSVDNDQWYLHRDSLAEERSNRVVVVH